MFVFLEQYFTSFHVESYVAKLSNIQGYDQQGIQRSTALKHCGPPVGGPKWHHHIPTTEIAQSSVYWIALYLLSWEQGV